jgi:hypothetical protein
MSRVPGGFKGKEAQPGFDAPFDEPVILFDSGVQIFDADVSSHLSGRAPSSFSSLKAFGYAAFLSTVMTRGGTV